MERGCLFDIFWNQCITILSKLVHLENKDFEYKYIFSEPASPFVCEECKISKAKKIRWIVRRVLLVEECDILRDQYFHWSLYDYFFGNIEVSFSFDYFDYFDYFLITEKKFFFVVGREKKIQFLREVYYLANCNSCWLYIFDLNGGCW